jgi:hydrogenase maturation protein HypF
MGHVSALRIHVKGVVQGVGFRPFVYKLATRLQLHGRVANSTSGVVIEVEGPSFALNLFCRDLVELSPPLSRIEQVESRPISPNGFRCFDIQESRTEAGYVLISPDIATCKACEEELFDPEDRRYRYPFINCTNCGPRFTIIADVPYDRPLTTMAQFKMCPACQSEYDDPIDRRFHAQPNACPVCGPRVWLALSSADTDEALEAPGGDPGNSKTIEACAEMLSSGKIIALKGLGGFHLACDATNPQAVRTLRERKRRFAKPFAVMVASLDEVRRHGKVIPQEEELLNRPSCPVVLIDWKPGSAVACEVAPGSRYLGVMLPYTPIHHILLHDVRRPLVMTSGNLSEEPIARTNKEAWDRLRDLADGFLFHNRDIYARYDDGVWFASSVSRNDGDTADAVQPIRRSRGDAPFPLKLPFSSRPLLACGPALKNTFCFTKDQYAFLSQHIGDLENLETMEHFETSVQLYEKLFRLRPDALIHDLHPDYLSTRYAEDRALRENLPLLGVQHHHAHAVSCLVDNGILEPVIAVTMDGTGYGLDGHIWGGEWLIADARGFRRVASLEPLPLPGADIGIRHPGRTAFAYLHWLFGPASRLVPTLRLEEPERRVVAHQVDREINLSWTSSCGRLFDVVAALGGGRLRVSYEAQGAIEMEMICRDIAESYPYKLQSMGQPMDWGETGHLPQFPSFHEVAIRPLLTSVVQDVKEGKSLSEIGSKFHRTIAKMVGEMSHCIAKNTGLKKVVLSGGCFQNRLLLKLAVEELRKHHLRPLLHHQVPTNDGGISLGQAVIGHFTLQ